MGRWAKNKKPDYYIDPAELRQSVIEMQELGQPTERFCLHLLTIQKHVLEFPRYRGYSQEIKDELTSFNQFRWMNTGWKAINPDKNIFAYITTGCALNFLSALTKFFKEFEKRKAILKKAYEEAGLDWRDSGYEEAENTEALYRKGKMGYNDSEDTENDTPHSQSLLRTNRIGEETI